MQKELVIVVTRHRKFGVIMIPHLIAPSSGNSLYSFIDKASPINIQDASGYCNDYEEIIKLYGTIEDVYIAHLFSKEPPVDFLRHVDKEFIETRIRPHIEIRLKKMVKLIIANNLRIFYKDPKYSQFYEADEIKLASGKSKMLFLFDRNENGIRYRIAIDHGDHYDTLKGKTAIVITDQSPCNVVINNVLYQFFDIDSKKFAPFLVNNFIHIRKETENVYFEKFILNVVKNFKVRATGFDVRVVREEPEPLLTLQTDLAGKPALMLKFRYGSRTIFPNNPDFAFVELNRDGDNVQFVKTLRKKDVEQEFVARLSGLHLTSTDDVNYYFDSIQTDDLQNALFLTINKINELSESFKANGFEIRQESFDKRYYLGNIDLTITAKQENDWFDLRGMVTINGFTFPFVKLRRNILKNIREFELPDGTVVVLPAEWFSRYFELFQAGQDRGDRLSVKKQMFGLLHESGIESADVEQMRKLFSPENMPKETLPEGLNATLRPYQLAGYYWMKLLKRNGFGGCLADDMGLGKTLQALALLLDSSTDKFEVEVPKEPLRGQLSLFDPPQAEIISKRPTSLVVMPLSLIHNWSSEAKKFAPSLKVLPYVGNNRPREVQIFDDYDVVITTYGLVRNDVDLLSTYPFYYVILDESQAIKNTASKNYKAVTSLKSKYRLVLTGTPIENSLTDLWAQMNFINAGLLGSLQNFKTEYVSRIERDTQCSRSRQLQALIEPFILRRTKVQVASDLPPKTEQIRVCEMEKEQSALYESEKSAIRNVLLERIAQDGMAKSSALVLQSLMKLRQIACHPRLAGFGEPSAKFDEVTRLLETVLSEKHKVLIFSSFVKYLNIYEEYLKEQGIKYVMLTGETQNRDAVISEFQNDEQTRVFLISLKAGGVGINLTSADYVFILDPWWNPSVENQAIDRAHRIGQDKNVFVYKFVTSGTLEEKITQLQNRKSDLASIFVNSNPLKDMTVDKLMELFS